MIKNKKTNIFSIFIVALIFVSTIMATSLVSAATPEDISMKKIPDVTQYTCAKLPQLEYNTTYQTILYIQGPAPNKTIYTVNTNMTSLGGFYYNYDGFCSTSQLGTYIVNGISDLGTWSYTFEVITMGTDDTAYLTIFIILTCIAFLFLYAAFIIKSEYLAFIAGVVFLVTGMFVIINGMANVNNLYTQTIGYVFLGVGLLFVLATGISIADENGLFDKLGVTGYKDDDDF